MIFRRLPFTGPGYLAPVADEAGRTGRPPTDDADVTCGRYALGEFTITPRRALDDERPPGLLAGRYEVGRLIGSGATARVYRAYDTRLAREVAVKLYDRDAVALDQRRRLREMTIQGSISHPGVVALLDSGTESGRTYLVMQLVEGENMAERLLGGPMPAAEVTALAEGLAEALAHVHARRIVHRDLKPANVFLSADGPLIGDFGIAHALDATHITGTGLIPGTAAYLAPEQVSGEPAGPPADVYALGLILLECLTGEREYPGTMVEAAMARLTRPPRIPGDLPASLAHALRRMTQRDPAERPTAAELVGLLQAPPDAAEWHPVWRRYPEAATDIAGPRDPGTGAVLSGDLGIGPGPGRDPEAGSSADLPRNPAARATPPRGLAIGPGPARDPEAGTSADLPRNPAAGAPSRPMPRGEPAADQAHDHDPTKTFAVSDLKAGTVPTGNRERRRLAAAAGLTAAAVAVVSAVLLVERETGTGSPAQPPAANSPAATFTPSSSTPPAGSVRTGTAAPRTTTGNGNVVPPPASTSASPEPAAVTHETPTSPEQTSKTGKPEKTEPPGKTKGKGPGHDS
ncbi:protein kinase [Amycolatopsis sp. NPDC021455]|uniref:serine/threonine-protein kinase n=1 Tax=Amycolatopsis sp. NPDC021455 TaxID=3154901 RepID=UPI0033CAFDA0